MQEQKKRIHETLLNLGQASCLDIVAESPVDAYGPVPMRMVSSIIENSICREGAESPFVRIHSDWYTAREIAGPCLCMAQDTSCGHSCMMPEIVTCFGQDWERDCVTWKEMPELLGRQVNSTQALNFAGQTGIYLLQQDLRIIYVGSTGELTLGDCLHKHAEDRLMDWNAFSFFGFVPVRDDGSFGVLSAKFTAQDVIAAMKFVLVISARPDKGDASECNFGAIEFFQADTGEYLKGQQFLA